MRPRSRIFKSPITMLRFKLRSQKRLMTRKELLFLGKYLNALLASGQWTIRVSIKPNLGDGKSPILIKLKSTSQMMMVGKCQSTMMSKFMLLKMMDGKDLRRLLTTLRMRDQI